MDSSRWIVEVDVGSMRGSGKADQGMNADVIVRDRHQFACEVFTHHMHDSRLLPLLFTLIWTPTTSFTLIWLEFSCVQWF